MIARFEPVSDYFLLGKVLKAHGTAGQLRLLVEDKYKSYLKPGLFIFFEIEGSKVPFEVMRVEEDAHFTVALKNFPKAVADTFSGMECWMPLSHIKKHHQQAPARIRDRWSDYTIVDELTGQRFIILRTEEFPQQLMAVIAIDSKELFIPLHEQLITSIDKENKILHMQIPEGLLSL